MLHPALALNRKNALLVGSDDGGDHWAVIASLIETCKLNDIDPQAWLADDDNGDDERRILSKVTSASSLPCTGGCTGPTRRTFSSG